GQLLCWGPSLLLHLLKADYWPASMLGPRQLALSVEFLFEILYVGAPGRIFVRLITVNIKLCA
ncbi:hypothetical protein EDM31_13505, partial [Staphylococcus aureus]